MKQIWDSITESVDSSRDELLDFLRELVRIPTRVPPGENYEKIAKVVAEKMREGGCSVELVDAPEMYLELSGKKAFGLQGPRVNVVGRKSGTGGSPVLVLNSHSDVVPDGPGWSVNPFGAEVKDGAVYGRGASDNKSGVAAMVMAVKALRSAGIRLKGDVVLTATVDEEIGGIAGLGCLIEEGIVRGDYGISLDGTIDSIWASLNGRLRWRVNSYGKAFHSSMAHFGINAIEKMAKVVLAIQEHSKQLQERMTSIPAHPDTGKPFIYPIASVGTIQGGIKDNIVPDRCTIAIDRRVTPEETLGSARNELRKVIEKAQERDPEMKIEIEEISVREPAAISMGHPLVRRLKEIAEKVIGSDLLVCGGTGSSDMAFLINQGGIPTCAIGPSRTLENNVHRVNEHVQIADLLSLTKIQAIAIAEILEVEM